MEPSSLNTPAVSGGSTGMLEQKAHQLEERARQLAFLEDQELKRGSSLNIIPPTPTVKRNQSPAVAAAQQAVITTLRQQSTNQTQIGTVAPVLVPTMPQAASYLHKQLQPQQQQQTAAAATTTVEPPAADPKEAPKVPPESQGEIGQESQPQ
jgi:hypothetical protein